jgi:hypothetical protein
MSSFPALDIAIGLSFIYLLLSLIVTTVNEMVAGWLKTRAAFLERGVSQLLQDPELKNRVYNHPLIKSLSSDGADTRPSYIPADKFATALMDVVTGHGNSAVDVAALRTGAQAISSPEFQQAINTIIDVSGDNPLIIKAKVEEWFNQGMDRVSGWYKRNAQRNTMILAVIITLVINADTLHIVDVLWKDPSTRAALVEQAKARTASHEAEAPPMVEYTEPDDPTASAPRNVPGSVLSDAEKQSINQLTGWTVEWAAWKSPAENRLGAFLLWLWFAIRQHLLGWVLTAIALSLGAPFWFDTLNRFMNIRNAGRAPDEKRSKAAPAQPAPAGQ